MNNEFLSKLTNLEDYEFFTLEHHFSIARMIRDVITKNGIDEKVMAEILNVKPERMREVLMGSYPFDLRLISKLQAYQQQLATENAKIKIEAEGIGFTTYKNQFPLYIDRIEKLLNILEEENKNK